MQLRSQGSIESTKHFVMAKKVKTMSECNLQRSLIINILPSLPAIVLLVTIASNLSAQTFTDLVVFGDSLSDVGNSLVLSQGAVPRSPPYFEGRFSNGPVWVEHVAIGLGLTASTASRSGGNNYAFAGAQAGTGTSTVAPGVPNVGPQIEAFLATGATLSANDLVVLWAGHNDVSGGIRNDVITANLSGHITTLHSNGGRNFLIGNVFNAPALNSQIAQEVNKLSEDISVSIATFDFAGLVQTVFAAPSSFGFTNTQGSACGGCGSDRPNIVDNPDGYVLWDSAHPSAAMHQLMGQHALESLATIAVPSVLQAGDADQDFDFDQFDLVQVQIAAKYLTGQPATWGDGDWNRSPGGNKGNPPLGDGMFNQLDIVAAQQAGIYLSGSYAAVQPDGSQGDGRASIVYNAGTGEVAVDAPAGAELTSINIDSASGIFTGEAAQNLGGSFDNDADGNIFKATFGGSFGTISFGNVAQAGMTEEFVVRDLTVVGSLVGGGHLGNVDLVYVPEPTSVLLLSVGIAIGIVNFRRGNR